MFVFLQRTLSLFLCVTFDVFRVCPLADEEEEEDDEEGSNYDEDGDDVDLEEEMMMMIQGGGSGMYSDGSGVNIPCTRAGQVRKATYQPPCTPFGQLKRILVCFQSWAPYNHCIFKLRSIVLLCLARSFSCR